MQISQGKVESSSLRRRFPPKLSPIPSLKKSWARPPVPHPPFPKPQPQPPLTHHLCSLPHHNHLVIHYSCLFPQTDSNQGNTYESYDPYHDPATLRDGDDQWGYYYIDSQEKANLEPYLVMPQTPHQLHCVPHSCPEGSAAL